MRELGRGDRGADFEEGMEGGRGWRLWAMGQGARMEVGEGG